MSYQAISKEQAYAAFGGGPPGAINLNFRKLDAHVQYATDFNNKQTLGNQKLIRRAGNREGIKGVLKTAAEAIEAFSRVFE